jgi:hypothetical protein
MMERGWWFVGGCFQDTLTQSNPISGVKDYWELTDARSRRCVHEPIGECVWLQLEHCS